MEESKLYLLLEVMDKRSKGFLEEQTSTNKENNTHRIVYPSYQSKKCDHQCIDCFLPFCLSTFDIEY